MAIFIPLCSCSDRLLNLERNLRSCLHLNPSDDNKAQIITDSECGSCVITKADLHPALTSICGILLPRLQTGSTHNQVCNYTPCEHDLYRSAP